MIPDFVLPDPPEGKRWVDFYGLPKGTRYTSSRCHYTKERPSGEAWRDPYPVLVDVEPEFDLYRWWTAQEQPRMSYRGRYWVTLAAVRSLPDADEKIEVRTLVGNWRPASQFSTGNPADLLVEVRAK